MARRQLLDDVQWAGKLLPPSDHVILSHPFVRLAPSFHPDLRAARAVERSGGQGWPVFGPPRQRRAASLTAASTTAC
jgi:hypothetical protein